MVGGVSLPLLTPGERDAESGKPMGVDQDAAVPVVVASEAPAATVASGRGFDSSAVAPVVFSREPADEPLSWLSLVFLAFIVVAGVLSSVASRSPGAVFLVYVAAVAPCLLVFWLIVRLLRDPVVSKSFLVGQVFITALPALILVFIIESTISVVGVLILLGDEAINLLQQYADGLKNIEGGRDVGTMTPAQKHAYDEAADALWQSIKHSIPMWKILAIIFIEAFLVAAFTEEMTKYLVGRRYRRLTGYGIRCRGVIACVSASALGLAATEHVMYSIQYVAKSGLFGGLLDSLLRAVIAIPLHVGTLIRDLIAFPVLQLPIIGIVRIALTSASRGKCLRIFVNFYMGTRMARHAILKQPKISLLVTLGVPILFHGTLDFYAFFAGAEARSAPILGFLATPLDIVLVFFLLMLCRRNYLQVIEMENGKDVGVSPSVTDLSTISEGGL